MFYIITVMTNGRVLIDESEDLWALLNTRNHMLASSLVVSCSIEPIALAYT